MLAAILISWLASALAFLIVAHVLPGFHVDSFQTALLAAFVVGFINGTLGAVIKLLLFPVRILTLGLASLVVNVAMLYLTSQVVAGFKLDGLFPAFAGSVLLTVVTWLLRVLFPDPSRREPERD